MSLGTLMMGAKPAFFPKRGVSFGSTDGAGIIWPRQSKFHVFKGNLAYALNSKQLSMTR